MNTDQRKHFAGVIDKVAIAYFAVVGYTSMVKGEWLVFGHAIIMFWVIEAIALLVLSEKDHDD